MTRLLRAGFFLLIVRPLLMHGMEKLFETIDLYIGGEDLVLANLTGHPSVVMPNGFR